MPLSTQFQHRAKDRITDQELDELFKGYEEDIKAMLQSIRKQLA